LAFAGGTDKGIEIFDFNKCQSVLAITDAHARSVHQITLNSSEHNQHSYDIFFTTSIGDGIKMWDLRIAQCVKKFDSHVARALACKIGLSPCSNYVFTGCDDRSVIFNLLIFN
jgi:WD40 repeat protein